jgi:short-subunit dehydrogenase
MDELQSEVVVVTGASSGIGEQTALRYAGRGAHLVLAARNEEQLERVAEACRAAGGGTVLVQATDIGVAAEVDKLFELAADRFGRIDIAVQSAAITAFGRFEDIPVEVFDNIIRTNLIGAANVARSALGFFRERRTGHLVLIGSLLGTTAVPYQSAYVASKFALNGLVRSLRQENRDLQGVKIHGVYPGPVDTPVYGTASNYYGRTPRVPPTAVKPDTVVSAIVRATGRQRSSERQVGLANLPAIAVYRTLPRLYDAVVGPFLRAVAFTSEPAEPTDGNAFTRK